MVINEADPRIIYKLADILDKNGVVILKCDTIYGIIGILNKTDIRIAEIKQRNPEKPFVCLIPHAEWVSRYAAINIPEKLKKYWPGPLTLIFPAKPGVIHHDTIALRVPQDKFLIKLLKITGKPLISTSVNKESEAPLCRIDDIIEKSEDKVDLIVNNGNLSRSNLASTLLSLCKKPYKVLRQGELVIPDEDLV